MLAQAKISSIRALIDEVVVVYDDGSGRYGDIPTASWRTRLYHTDPVASYPEGDVNKLSRLTSSYHGKSLTRSLVTVNNRELII